MFRKPTLTDMLAMGAMLFSALITAVFYPQLRGPFPTHFNLAGQPNGWTALPVGAFILPTVSVVVWTTLRFVAARLRASSIETSRAVPMTQIAMLTILLLTVLQIGSLAVALDLRQTLPWTGVSMGLFWVATAQILPRIRRNRRVGVRTPWTLDSDENWLRTHRFAGYGMTIAGIMSILAGLCDQNRLALGLIIGSGLAPIAYSWWLADRASPT